MPLHVFTAAYSYRGEDRLDISRQGCDREPAGATSTCPILAPGPSLIWPAKSTADLVARLSRRGRSLEPHSEARAVTLMMADTLARHANQAYARLYTEQMRDSYRRSRGEWDALLARDTVTLVCFCPRREADADQVLTCHRHYAVSILAKLVAEDMGERELPPPARPARPKAETSWANLVAVTGCRPPTMQMPECQAIYERITADVVSVIRSLPRDSIVVHGGAEGVDKVAEAAAKRRGMAMLAFPPWYDAWGKGAPLVRNAYVGACGKAYAWPAPWSKGSLDAIAKARAMRVEVIARTKWCPES